MGGHALTIALVLAALSSTQTAASELVGPARFCGYSPIIDLKSGERIITLEGGIHGGAFRWEGSFGRLEVHGIGWASEPKGRALRQRTSRGHTRFAQARRDDGYEVAIWNKKHAAAYFRSSEPLTPAQLAAIDTVDLFEEGEEPQGCDLRTTFSWE